MTIFKNGKLRDAGASGDIERMRALLAEGADINSDDGYYGTALYRAVTAGGEEAVRFLLEHGALPDDKVRNYQLPMIQRAVEMDRADIICLLLDKQPELLGSTPSGGGSLLHLAAKDGREKAARVLLDRASEMLETQDGSGDRPLHIAAHNGHAELVALLIERGADASARNNANRTPLFMAQKQNNGEIVEILHPLTPSVRSRATPEGQGSREWKKLAGERVAHVCVEETIGYRITEIFNFESRERTIIHQNLETRAETAQTDSFDHLGRGLLETALAELHKSGGTADASVLGGLGKKRLGP